MLKSSMTMAAVREALRGPLPGAEAQQRMATRPRSTPGDFAHAGPPRESAVLILLYPQGGALYLPLTKRTERVANHKGQISFPGGSREPEDATLYDTALREAAEEIGVDPATVERLGALTQLTIPASHFVIQPYLAACPARPAFAPDPAEVAELIELPLEALLDPASKREERWEWRGRPTDVPYYAYQGHVIWGATAMMLSELEALLRETTEGQRHRGTEVF